MMIDDEDNNNKDDSSRYTYLRYLFPYLRPYGWQLTAAIVALVTTSVSVLALGRGMGHLIDTGFVAGNDQLLNRSLLVMVAIIAVLALGTFARFYFITSVGERVIAAMRQRIYQHILLLSPAFFETHKAGDIVSRMTTDSTLLQVVVGSSVSVALRNVLLLTGGIAMLFYTSSTLTVITLVAVPCVVFPVVYMGRKLRVLSKEAQYKVALLSAYTEETIHGIKAIQAFTREDAEHRHFTDLVHDSLTVALQRITLRGLLTAVVILFVFTAIAFVLWVGGHAVLNEKMSAGELSSFIFYAVVVAAATGAISEVFGDLQRAAGAMERVIEFLSVKPLITDSAQPLAQPVQEGKGRIAFREVTFCYATKLHQPALEHFSLTIEPGEKIALVGHSGAGKSTIFQLLLRFYDVGSGSIWFDGRDIRTLPLKALRQFFALVPQDPVIFSASVYDNILMGNDQANEAEVNDAVAKAAAHFVYDLPQGLQSFVGEKGVRLSGGEKQRIAIARAFLRNPKVLLLDEATSALDSVNEALVHQGMASLMKDRTTLVIAHRLATIEKVNRIVVINNGKIVEIGTHAELLKNGAVYADLVKRQACFT